MHFRMKRSRRGISDDSLGLASGRWLSSSPGLGWLGIPEREAAGERKPVSAVGAGQSDRPDVSPRALAVHDGVKLTHLGHVAFVHEVKHESHIE